MLSAILHGSAMEAKSGITPHPSQWREMHAGEPPEAASVELVRAVFIDALCCFGGRPGLASLSGPRAQKALQVEAACWIDDRGLWPFSFEWSCEVLGLNPERSRAAIQGENAPAIFLALRRAHRQSARGAHEKLHGNSRCRRRRREKKASRVSFLRAALSAGDAGCGEDFRHQPAGVQPAMTAPAAIPPTSMPLLAHRVSKSPSPGYEDLLPLDCL
jgi:hypothetical protein